MTNTPASTFRSADNTGPELQSAGTASTDSTGQEQREQAVERRRPPCIKGVVTDGVLGLVAECEGADDSTLGLGDVSFRFANYAASQLVHLTVSGKPPEGAIDLSLLNALMHLAAAVEPADELEAALAVQMAMLHHLALDCGRRAMATGSTLEGRALNVSQAGKLSRSYAMLMDALARHRGRVSIQRVIVENVHVAAGGQAVVGIVPRGGGSKNLEERVHGPEERSTRSGADARECDPALLRHEPGAIAMSEAGQPGQKAMSPSRRRAGVGGTARK